ncbi:MAG: ligase-associated DNA damage response exonuclease [Flavobacteriales bacterium]|nr:ligase-associated DNA damage response exonuclease [Flavobacteriales bacterium]
MAELVTLTDHGLYCPQADLYIDPWKGVKRAIITHGHSDHARYGSTYYLCHHHSIPILKTRLGDIAVQGLDYGETIISNGVTISLHPAGHVVGSAQVRLEYKGEVWVISGDYKTQADGISQAFEPVTCHTFITESTFGLPFFHWQPQWVVMRQIQQWWERNRSDGISSILFAYSLGKAQRILANLDTSVGPIIVHGATHAMNEACRQAGINLPPTYRVSELPDASLSKGALVIAPSSAAGNSWLRRFEPYRTAVASGWMAMRGARRWQAADRGFILSDHADWHGLNQAIQATGAKRILVTHGYADLFSRWLIEQGLNASVLKTQFTGEQVNEPETEITET